MCRAQRFMETLWSEVRIPRPILLRDKSRFLIGIPLDTGRPRRLSKFASAIRAVSIRWGRRRDQVAWFFEVFAFHTHGSSSSSLEAG